MDACSEEAKAKHEQMVRLTCKINLGKWWTIKNTLLNWKPAPSSVRLTLKSSLLVDLVKPNQNHMNPLKPIEFGLTKI